MKNSFLLIFSISLLTSCATHKGNEIPKVKQAIDFQKTVIEDPLFSKILRELDEDGEIDWQVNSTSKIKEDLTTYNSKIDWLIEKYIKEEPFNGNTVLVKRLINPKYWRSTTALTSTCGKNTTLAKGKLKKRDTLKVMNTIFHERVHSFCFLHPKDQTRETNQCDPSYIAGDLAEIIVSYRQGMKSRIMDKPICQALKKKIEEYNLIVIE
jgi:hypothetical protein